MQLTTMAGVEEVDLHCCIWGQCQPGPQALPAVSVNKMGPPKTHPQAMSSDRGQLGP